MKLTAEISLYPLNEKYEDVIKDFVRGVRRHEGIELVTNAMSTQLSGDYDLVFDVVRSQLRSSYERNGKQVLVCKFIVGELEIGRLPEF